jgi:hypothetical protein
MNNFALEHEGVSYVAVPETLGCNGCYGVVNQAICDVLPAGCAKQKVIWVVRTPETQAACVAMLMEAT